MNAGNETGSDRTIDVVENVIRHPLTSVDETVRSVGRRLIDRWPAAQRVLLTGRDAYVRAYLWQTQQWNALQYDAPPDPYRLIRVNPAEIEFTIGSLPDANFRYSGVVAGGDWDRPRWRFADMDVYRAYERHFKHGVDWSETAFFSRIVDEIENGEEQWGCTSRAAFEQRCERLDRLYETIESEGYRSQAELLASGVDDPIKRGPQLRTERFNDELTVHIDRDGAFLFDDGRNRLSIVKLLDCDEIPVRVLLRHEQWQQTRDEYVAGGCDDLADHPDLRGLERRIGSRGG